MNINWKVKSFIYRWLDILSLHRALYFLQKNVTKRSRIDIREIDDTWLTHQHNLLGLQNPKILEFGAGKSLAQNIYLSRFVKSQTVVDLFPMLDIDLFNVAARQIAQLTNSQNFISVSDVSEIESHYGIKYVAPLDVRKTPFADSYFDGCTSTATLEHIPKEDVVATLLEIKRITRPGGLVSAIIDYSDHYSHTDKNIGPLNYLRYSTADFEKFNHKIHYQNRLRHYDYVRIFKELDYELLLEDALFIAEPPDVVSSEFDSAEPSLCATTGIFLARNNK